MYRVMENRKQPRAHEYCPTAIHSEIVSIQFPSKEKTGILERLILFLSI